jgi:pimeloyl-ACP methyl ester carboxylesterase
MAGGLAAMPDSPLGKVVMMSAPPYAAVHPRRAADRIRLARDLPPQSPSLYRYGRDDDRVAAVFAHCTQRVLPAGSEVAVIDRAGHFLQLGQPDAVAERVLAFIGA